MRSGQFHGTGVMIYKIDGWVKFFRIDLKDAGKKLLFPFIHASLTGQPNVLDRVHKLKQTRILNTEDIQ